MESQAMAVREENWIMTIQAGMQSEKGQKAWCEENGIAPSTFYYRKRQLRERLLSNQQKVAVPEPCFVQLPLSARPIEPAQNQILLHAESITLELPLSCSEEELCKVLRAVRHAR
ncbi:MAG: hypothetical protein RR825_08895 [Ruthenibacterium sp.]